MNLLPGDIILVRRGTLWMPFAPFIWAWQKIADPTTPWSWAYHVEMVWDATEGYYKAFSLQPPVLRIVERKMSDISFTAYRVKNRSDDLTEKFWRWGNEWLDSPEFYVLGVQTCGHPVVKFYSLPCDPYPASIEAFCMGSSKWIKVA